MTKEEKIQSFTRIMSKCPEVLTPSKVIRWTPLAKNTVYKLIKDGVIHSVRYRGTYIISKEDVIEYLAEHCDDEPNRNFSIGHVAWQKGDSK